ncbi:hypothetical protein LXL04_037842 [Taraxacum kok-saghyz]
MSERSSDRETKSEMARGGEAGTIGPTPVQIIEKRVGNGWGVQDKSATWLCSQLYRILGFCFRVQSTECLGQRVERGDIGDNVMSGGVLCCPDFLVSVTNCLQLKLIVSLCLDPGSTSMKGEKNRWDPNGENLHPPPMCYARSALHRGISTEDTAYTRDGSCAKLVGAVKPGKLFVCGMTTLKSFA